MTFAEEKQILLFVRNLGALLMYGSILVYLIYPPLLDWAKLDQISLPLRWIALGLMALMPFAFYWLFSNLGKNITPTVSIRESHQLVTSGPYRWIRHPLYTFGFLNILLLCIAAANGLLILLTFVTFIPLAMRTPLEEKRLLEAFGQDYRDYMNRTGRYLPKLFFKD